MVRLSLLLAALTACASPNLEATADDIRLGAADQDEACRRLVEIHQAIENEETRTETLERLLNLANDRSADRLTRILAMLEGSGWTDFEPLTLDSDSWVAVFAAYAGAMRPPEYVMGAHSGGFDGKPDGSVKSEAYYWALVLNELISVDAVPPEFLNASFYRGSGFSPDFTICMDLPLKSGIVRSRIEALADRPDLDDSLRSFTDRLLSNPPW